MVFVTLPWPRAEAASFVAALREAGVVINPPKGTRVRFVTDHDVSAADVAEAARWIARAARDFGRRLPTGA